MNAVTVGECGFDSVSQQVVAVVDAGAVRRSQVGDRQTGILEPQNGVLRGNATVDRADTEIDAGLDTLFAIGPPINVSRTERFGVREEFRELDGVRAAACDDALVVLPIGGDGGGPFDDTAASVDCGAAGAPRVRAAPSRDRASQKRPLMGALHADTPSQPSLASRTRHSSRWLRCRGLRRRSASGLLPYSRGSGRSAHRGHLVRRVDIASQPRGAGVLVDLDDFPSSLAVPSLPDSRRVPLRGPACGRSGDIAFLRAASPSWTACASSAWPV
jgi:hypothetical protein